MNADGYTSTGQGVLGNNMFVYCGNNPVNYVDPTGCLFNWIFDFVDNVIEEISNALETIVQIANDISLSIEESNQEPLTQDQKVLVATIAAEATVTAQGDPVSKEGRQAMANVAINRVGSREWSNYTTVAEVCQNTGFDGYGDKNYMECMVYLDARDGSNTLYEAIIWDVQSVYKNDITGGCQLYYTPAAMNPPGSIPHWNFGALTEVTIPGVDTYYEGRFYKYK